MRTVILLVIGVDVEVRHEMVNTVSAVIGTVEALPESDDWEKLPSGDVSVQLVTPVAFQKIEVRPPSDTEVGDAQICTTGGTYGVASGTGVVVVACAIGV